MTIQSISSYLPSLPIIRHFKNFIPAPSSLQKTAAAGLGILTAAAAGYSVSHFCSTVHTSLLSSWGWLLLVPILTAFVLDRRHAQQKNQPQTLHPPVALPPMANRPSAPSYSLEEKDEFPDWHEVTPSESTILKRSNGLTRFLRHMFYHEPHLAHNQKYLLSLDEQEAGLREFLSHYYPFNNSPIDLLMNLKKAYRGEAAEEPYHEFRDCKNSRYIGNVIESLDALLHPEKFATVRARNAAYLLFLRNALESDEYNQAKFPFINDLLRNLCRTKFLQNKMTNYEDGFLALAVKNIPEKLSSATIAQAIHHGNERLAHADPSLRKAPQDLLWQKTRNELGIFSDPLGTSNIPEIRSIHSVDSAGDTYPIVYMRHGTPTYEPNVSVFLNRVIKGANTVRIVPEYRGFLDAAAMNKDKILYVNHQNMSKAGPEFNRGEALQNLQIDYPGTFHFLSLPYDGILFEELKNCSMDAWKKNIVNSLIEQKKGFRLPRDFRIVRGQFEEIAEAVHKLYFNGSPDLNAKQRRIFLTIFYSYVKEVIKAELKINAMVSACKDNKDRGNVSAGIDESLFNLRLGKENNPQALYDLYVRTLSPFIIKYEHIIPRKLEVLLDVLDHIGKLTIEQKKAIQKYEPVDGYSIVEQTVPRGGLRSAIPLSEMKFDSPEALIGATSESLYFDFPEARSKLVYDYIERDPRFPDRLRQGFCDMNGQWNVKKLLRQLDSDLPRISVCVNEVQCNDLKTLLNTCKTSAEELYSYPKNHTDRERQNRLLSFLSCLQQGAGAVCLEGVDRLIKTSKKEIVILNGISKSPDDKITRINATINPDMTDRIFIEQDLCLDVGRDEPIPITVRADMSGSHRTRVTWSLAESPLPSGSSIGSML